jgi:hypothetical protein
MRKSTPWARITLLTATCLMLSGPALADQWIIGSVSIRDATGHHHYGEYLAVFLVNAKQPVTAADCGTDLHPQQRIDCINNAHLEFYKRFQDHQRQAGYLIDQTVTSSTGQFAFFDVPVGDYHVLVKFPSMIDGYKVAWQEPTTVKPDRISVVTLNEDNLVLPKNRRR